MIRDLIDRIPTEHAFNIVGIVLIVALVAAGFGAGYWGRHTYVITTRVVHVQKSWGTPDSTIPASAVTVQTQAGMQTLSQAGMTACGYYQAKNTLVCH